LSRYQYVYSYHFLFLLILIFMFFFFFFQAEDGIRDKLVTGVQTCALPIWCVHPQAAVWIATANNGRESTDKEKPVAESGNSGRRSEERRVGKECRYRWWREH